MKCNLKLAPLALGVALCLGLVACSDDDDNDSTPSPTPTPENGAATPSYFNRIANFAVCSQIEPTCNTDEETSAEIVAASQDGMTLIYTDSPLEQVGFVDITDPTAPTGLGTLALTGEPTSVAVQGDYALVAINTSADFVNVSGELVVIDIASRSVITTLDLGGQPDSIAVSPDGAYAAVVIENERDEDLGEGEPPQAPAGEFIILSLSGEPASWTQQRVDMTGIATLFPNDPEPEYVDINADNIAVVTLQENNHIILVDLSTGDIVNHFSAGTVSLDNIDASESKPAIIAQNESLSDIPREPDGVSWISTTQFATADEGDLFGGSRGFTIFDTDGNVVFAAGNSLEHQTARLGHYPDKRSENKGNEPENVEYGSFDNNPTLIVASERSSLLFVYDVTTPSAPTYRQTLAAGAGPEGVLAIPSRNLLIAASEEDNRGDKIRAVLGIYTYGNASADYPLIESADSNGVPLPWGALSGLAANATDNNTLYSVHDSFYQQSRIYDINVANTPAKIEKATPVTDSNDVLATLSVTDIADTTLPAHAAERRDVFDSLDLQALINADKTVNLDLEGIAVASDGGFWLVSEGKGTVGEHGDDSDADDNGRPVESANLLIKTDAGGVITQAVMLPDALNQIQLRFGFEGVAEYDGKVYVAMQRAWGDEDNPRIGIYDVANDAWQFMFYPLEASASAAGGWVGLSDITPLGNGRFLIIERDNQGGPDAAIKRLYSVDISTVTDGATLNKTLERDLLNDLSAGGAIIAEKVEGSAITSNGDVFIINDNDGVDDNSGETRLLNLGAL